MVLKSVYSFSGIKVDIINKIQKILKDKFNIKSLFIISDILIFFILLLLSIKLYIFYPYQVVPRDVFVIKNQTYHINNFFSNWSTDYLGHYPLKTIYDLYIYLLEFIFLPLEIHKFFMIFIIILFFLLSYYAIYKKFKINLLFPAIFFSFNTIVFWFLQGGDGWIILAPITAFFPIYWIIFSKDKISLKDYIIAIIPIILSAIPWMYYLTLFYFIIYSYFKKEHLNKNIIKLSIFLFIFSFIFYYLTSSYMIYRLLNPSHVNPYSIYMDIFWAYTFNPWFIFTLAFNKANAIEYYKILKANYIYWIIFGIFLFIIAIFYYIILQNKKYNKFLKTVLKKTVTIKDLYWALITIFISYSLILLIYILLNTDIFLKIPILIKIFSIFRAPTKIEYFIYFGYFLLISISLYIFYKVILNKNIVSYKIIEYLIIALYVIMFYPLFFNGFLGYSTSEIKIYTYNPNIYPKLNISKGEYILYLPYTVELLNIVGSIYPQVYGAYVNAEMMGYNYTTLKKIAVLYDSIKLCSNNLPILLKKENIKYIIIDGRFGSPYYDTILIMSSPFIYGNYTNFLDCLGKFYDFKLYNYFLVTKIN